MLEFDYTNVLDSAVGSHGISRQAFGNAARSSQQWIDALEKLRTSGDVGFADLPFEEKPVAAVTAFARNHAYPNVLILGIGGSALGPAALDAALGQPHSGKRLIVLDNIDPDFIQDTLDTLAPEDTLVNVIAKSGVTAETMSSFALVREWMNAALGAAKARDHFAVTTDPEKGDLLAIAQMEKYATFEIPPNIGGRFSVLSPVGILPAALLGIDVEAMMEGARRTVIQSRLPFEKNPAMTAAFVQHTLDRERQKNILVLFPYAQSLWKFAFWFKQLWGESTGKKMDRQGREIHCGQTPTAALGATDQHSQLQLFIEGPNDKSYLFWAVREFRNTLKLTHPYKDFDSMGYLENRSMAELFESERRATEMAITDAGRPNATVYVDRVNEESLGDLIMFSQYMTAYAGELYNINAFDQPGVEYGKKLTFAMMGRAGYEKFNDRIQENRRRERAIVR